MAENDPPTLDEVRRHLSEVCEHLRECAMLYGDKRFDHGVPEDRDWAVFPMCRALNALVEVLAETQERLTALEERQTVGQAVWQAAVARPVAAED